MKDTFLPNLLLLITLEQILTLQMVLEEVCYVAWQLSNHDQIAVFKSHLNPRWSCTSWATAIEIKRNAWIKIEIKMLWFNAFSCYAVYIDGKHEIASLICSL